MDFENSTMKFGKVEEGTPVHFDFTFKNTSDSPLIINEAKTSCTCTKVDFPRSPIPPNSTGVVKVDFDTNGKIGYQQRDVELKTNVGVSKITFKGTVKASQKTKDQHKESN